MKATRHAIELVKQCESNHLWWPYWTFDRSLDAAVYLLRHGLIDARTFKKIRRLNEERLANGA